jgi:hypothetical protein
LEGEWGDPHHIIAAGRSRSPEKRRRKKPENGANSEAPKPTSKRMQSNGIHILMIRATVVLIGCCILSNKRASKKCDITKIPST